MATDPEGLCLGLNGTPCIEALKSAGGYAAGVVESGAEAAWYLTTLPYQVARQSVAEGAIYVEAYRQGGIEEVNRAGEQIAAAKRHAALGLIPGVNTYRQGAEVLAAYERDGSFEGGRQLGRTFFSVGADVTIVYGAAQVARRTVSLEGTLARVEEGVNHPLGRASAPPVRPAESPHYSVAFEGTLKPGTLTGSDTSHFRQMNRQLHAAFQLDPAYAAAMEELYPGITKHVAPGPRGGVTDTAPPGTTWHHQADRPGGMQLVPTEQHQAAGPVQQSLHPGGRGGRANWGGGRRRPN
jgi:hypothetical protein